MHSWSGTVAEKTTVFVAFLGPRVQRRTEDLADSHMLEQCNSTKSVRGQTHKKSVFFFWVYYSKS